jgi:hypothetical protein
VARTAVANRGLRRRALGISLLAVLFVFSLSACGGEGGTEASGDKTVETLNFSAASAADAGVYGLTLEGEDEGQQVTPEEEYTSFGPVSDATGAVTMEVPTEWSETVGEVAAESPYQAGLAASPNLQGYSNSWDFPGAYLGVSKSLGQQVATAELPDVKLTEVFAALSPRNALKQDCDPSVRSGVIRPGEQNAFAVNLTDLLEFGNVDLYSNCGGQGGAFIDFAGLSKDRTSVLYMQIGLVAGKDVGATLRMIETLAIDFTKVPEPATEQEENPDLVVP